MVVKLGLIPIVKVSFEEVTVKAPALYAGNELTGSGVILLIVAVNVCPPLFITNCEETLAVTAADAMELICQGCEG